MSYARTIDKNIGTFDKDIGGEGAARPQLDRKPSSAVALVFIGLLAAGVCFSAYNLISDIATASHGPTAWLPFVLLGVALMIALGFEFVNVFHDTANAVATVIYTHSLPPQSHLSLRPRGFGRAGRDGDHRRRGHVRPAGVDHAPSVFGRGENHCSQPFRPADGDDP
jgi:hypothetical protein